MGNYITALEWAKYDTGAMEFLTMLNRQDEYTINVITEKLLTLPRIRGRKLYNLWVISEHSFDRVLKLCENCPDDILTDACSRQDYSGKELVNQYFNQ
jgi:hypothetical protein